MPILPKDPLGMPGLRLRSIQVSPPSTDFQNVPCSPTAKASFEPDQIVDNLAALVDAINRAKPSGAKGQYLKALTIASTMGPGIRVDVPGVLAAAVA